MISTIQLIFGIASALIKIGPSVYDGFMEILAAIPKTDAAGNDTTLKAVKLSARAIMPVLDAPNAQLIQDALDRHATMFAVDTTANNQIG